MPPDAPRPDLRPALAALAVVVCCATIAVHHQAPPEVPAHAPAAAPPAPGAPAAADLLFDRGLDLNAATADDLAALPGIGPSRATSIVELRDEIRCFDRVEELLDVSGIGEKTLARLRPLVRIGPCPGAR